MKSPIVLIEAWRPRERRKLPLRRSCEDTGPEHGRRREWLAN